MCQYSCRNYEQHDLELVQGLCQRAGRRGGTRANASAKVWPQDSCRNSCRNSCRTSVRELAAAAGLRRPRQRRPGRRTMQELCQRACARVHAGTRARNPRTACLSSTGGWPPRRGADERVSRGLAAGLVRELRQRTRARTRTPRVDCRGRTQTTASAKVSSKPPEYVKFNESAGLGVGDGLT